MQLNNLNPATANASGLAAVTRMDALLAGQYEILPYARLPRPHQLAIAFYMAIDGEAWDLFLEQGSYPASKPSMAFALEKVLAQYVETYGETRFGVATIPTERLVTAVMDDPELTTDFKGSLPEYRAWFASTCGVPIHGDTDRWPVILSSVDDETLQDGWHRFHSYVASEHPDIPAVFYPASRHFL